MTTKYSWLVENSIGDVMQVDADRVDVTQGGGIAFYCTHGEGEYLVCWFPDSSILEIQIMSQMTGEPNGYRTIGNSQDEE